MNYWIFKANPEHYRIDERLLDSNPNLVWAVTRYHERIQKGDTVFIWRAGTPRGICAVMLIDANPYEPEQAEIYDGYEIPAGTITPLSEHWAKGHLIRRFPVIDMSVIKKVDGLELFSFFSAFQQAVNFSITRPEGTILLEFIEQYLADAPIRERENAQKLAAKIKKPALTRSAPAARAVNVKKSKPAAPAVANPDFALLKCAACGRYVVSSDTDRHIREVHAGQPVEWKKTSPTTKTASRG